MRKSKTLATRALQKRETTDILTLIRRAEAGDKAAMTALRPVLNHAPEAWEMAGNLGQPGLPLLQSFTRRSNCFSHLVSSIPRDDGGNTRQELSCRAPLPRLYHATCATRHSLPRGKLSLHTRTQPWPKMGASLGVGNSRKLA